MQRDAGSSIINRLESAITPKTRGLFINTPSNPTGWTATEDDLRQILDLARRHDLWIMADEIYALYFYAGARAPSFLDVMRADDRIIFVNSFSKNWSMTGWRVGWIVAPEELGQAFENLIQYSTSGVAQFMQRGATVALNEGDHVIAENYAKAARCRDMLCDALIATNRVETLKPDGALYAFLKIDGSRIAARQRLKSSTRPALAWLQALPLVPAAVNSCAPAFSANRKILKRLRKDWRNIYPLFDCIIEYIAAHIKSACVAFKTFVLSL